MNGKYIVRIFYACAICLLLGTYQNMTAFVSVIDDVNIETEKDKEEDKEEEGMSESPKIALTFDDGPGEATGRLLDELKERNVKATFFVIGEYAEKYPELIQREVEEGHIVGNHTYSHVDIAKLSEEEAKEEIEKTNQIVKEISGATIEYIRPPFGDGKRELEEQMNLMTVMWSVDPLDWTTENEEEIVNKVVTDTSENDIILLHDCYESSVNAAIRIIDILQAEGYEFVTVEELLLN